MSGNKTPTTSCNLYFPPPPTSTIAVNDKSHMKKKPKIRTNPGLALNEPPKSILKRLSTAKRQRQFILLAILTLAFTILVLGGLFAYCAALPHSDKQSSASDSTNGTVSMQRRSSNGTDSSLQSDINTESQDEKQFETTSARAALLFYTAFLPLLSILHASTELLVSLVRTQTFTRRAQATISRRRKILPMISFCATCLLLVGWLPLNIVWLNCEVVKFGGDKMCPIQIRGHNMAGVDEVALAKDVLAWVLMGVYIGYLGWLVWKGRIFKNDLGTVSTRRARFAEKTVKDDGESGDEIVIGADGKQTVRNG